jgi:hypothetical protein
MEFEQTIIPAVLNMGFVDEWRKTNPPYIQDNPGFDRLLNIINGHEPSLITVEFYKFPLFNVPI